MSTTFAFSLIRLPLTLFALLCLAACGTDRPQGDAKTQTPADSPQKDSVTSKLTTKTPAGLSEFENIEMSRFCVLLPLDSYGEVFGEEQVKGYHAFEPKVKSSDQEHLKQLGEFRHIDVQTFLIDPENYRKADIFYNSDLQDSEENNLVIDTSYVQPGFYCIRGHLSNYEELKFARLAWVRDDKVVLNTVYHGNDADKWDSWLEQIIAHGVDCKN